MIFLWLVVRNGGVELVSEVHAGRTACKDYRAILPFP